MMTESGEIDFSPVAPRWTWKVVGMAGIMTALLFVLLPMTEGLAPHPEPDLQVRDLNRVLVPPALKPPPPPLENLRELESRPQNLPEPVLAKPVESLPSLRLPVDLQPSFEGLKGISSNSFQIEDAGLATGLKQGAFEIADLDTPPRPLVRVNPVYPPRARMRKIEGDVTVEFVVLENGDVGEISVVAGDPGDIFRASVERAVRAWRFEPGKIQGKAVPSRIRQRIDFTLD